LTIGVGVTAVDDAEYAAATTPIDVAVSAEPEPLTTSPLLLLDRTNTPQSAVTAEPPLMTKAFEAVGFREYMQAGPLTVPLTARVETLTVL
jgi:hypothetical protein